MMRAIRDNEEAANAMGKNVVKQHLLIFVLGSAIVGIAGAMLVTQDGLFTPGSYRPFQVDPGIESKIFLNLSNASKLQINMVHNI